MTMGTVVYGDGSYRDTVNGGQGGAVTGYNVVYSDGRYSGTRYREVKYKNII